ncbi:4'-phosphopantetheinyl transferase superfamily protein [Planomonospora sp. ID82291]|uniref:4'-phosphopantetheinyl transferase family protein n=1 Tax=Planomonospora sp. ID82291 TaxID=2738136 RepID=UPI0018C42DE0|nr:4'-phosphopantetheinyl transferase superfamily protein [Planomonospora sp. ID82291]MBG0813134.1 4'-phosphopantetheinyl transferase superfamily protein [Planomonospora sp. ID82291]
MGVTPVAAVEPRSAGARFAGAPAGTARPDARARAWPSGVRVWKVRLDRAERPEWWGWLSEGERERARAFARAVDRRRYVVAHAALRSVLGGVCGVPAARVGLSPDPAGRPRLDLDLGGDRPALDFNLSHSDGWALIAVAPEGRRVGADVERVRGDLDPLAMADRLYRPEEAARLRAAAPDAALAGYFRLWTAKEAFVKATGGGLARLGDVLVRGEGREGSATCERSRSLRGPVRWLDVADGYAAAVVTIASTPAPRTG